MQVRQKQFAVTGLPADPGDAVPTLLALAEDLATRVRPDLPVFRLGIPKTTPMWVIEPELGDSVAIYVSLEEDGLRSTISLEGEWDEDPPETWQVDTEVGAVSRALGGPFDEGIVINGAMIMGLITGAAVASYHGWSPHSAVVRVVLWSSFAGALLWFVTALVALTAWQERSAPPPRSVTSADRNAFRRAVWDAADELVADGRLAPL